MAARPGISYPKGIGVPISPAVITGPGSVSLWAGGIDLAWENLTNPEITIFDRDLVKIARSFSQSRDLQTVFLQDRDTYLYGLSIAKKQLAAGFGGVSPGSGQIGMQLIRSKLILGAANWWQSFTTPGWNDVLRTSASPVDLSSTSTTYGAPQNRATLCFPKLIDRTTPKLLEAYFHIGPTDYSIFPLQFFGVADLFVANLPAAVYVGKNGRFHMRGNIEARNIIEGVAPLGLCFALAEFMVGSGQE